MSCNCRNSGCKHRKCCRGPEGPIGPTGATGATPLLSPRFESLIYPLASGPTQSGTLSSGPFTIDGGPGNQMLLFQAVVSANWFTIGSGNFVTVEFQFVASWTESNTPLTITADLNTVLFLNLNVPVPPDLSPFFPAIPTVGFLNGGFKSDGSYDQWIINVSAPYAMSCTTTTVGTNGAGYLSFTYAF